MHQGRGVSTLLLGNFPTFVATFVTAMTSAFPHHALMNTEANTQAMRAISTDAKFWWFLVPFLFGSAGVWSYFIWWLVYEAPTAIPRFMGILTSWA